MGRRGATGRLETRRPLLAVSICHDFATTRIALIRFIQRIRDFSSREISFYAAKADYALYAVLGPRLDTVGVWVQILTSLSLNAAGCAG